MPEPIPSPSPPISSAARRSPPPTPARSTWSRRTLRGRGLPDAAGRPQRHPEPLRPLGHGRPGLRLQRPYRRGAARRCRRLAPRPVRRGRRRGQALGPRRRRHEVRASPPSSPRPPISSARRRPPARSSSRSPATRRRPRSTAPARSSTGWRRRASGWTIASSASRRAPTRMGDMIEDRPPRLDDSAYFVATGRQGHSAYPERALNPLPALVRLLDRLAARIGSTKGPRISPPRRWRSPPSTSATPRRT